MSTVRKCDSCGSVMDPDVAKDHWWQLGRKGIVNDFCTIQCVAKFIQARLDESQRK